MQLAVRLPYAKEFFAEGVGSLRELLGVKTSVRAAEVMTHNMAAHADGFVETRAGIDADAEQEIIVLAADGKGVPMRRSWEQRLREQQATAAAKDGDVRPSGGEVVASPQARRLKPGEKRTRKQMAYVGAVQYRPLREDA